MSTPRNVLLLMTDQQRWDTIHALGNHAIKTPNLDRLCAMGTAFRHGYTPVPVCGPARHRVFTGASSQAIGRTNSKLNWHPHARSFQSVLAQAGYHTGGFGKMHFEPTRDSHGFQHFALHEEMQTGGHEYREDDDYFAYLRDHGLGDIRYPCGVRNLLYTQPQVSPIPEEHHETKWVADQAIDFIETFHKSPFLCYASWMQPHWPVHVPENWADLYPTESMAPPVWSEDELPHQPWISKLMRRASDFFDDDKPPAIERVRRAKALYYASISFIDHQVGRILDTLERLGLLESTLIIFTADHGEMLGDHQTVGKCLPYEASVRVPFIAAGPGLKAGEVSDDFVSLYDVAPTVYGFTGVEAPEGTKLIGASVLGERAEVKARDSVVSELGGGNDGGGFISIRTRRWKYAFYHGAGVRQLFDLEADPDELVNCLLSPTDEQTRIAAELHQRLLAWNAEYGCAERLEDGDFKVIEPPPVWPDRNSQIETFVRNVPEDELATMWSEARSVYEAIRKEPELDVAELDLEYWESKFGPGCIAELEGYLGRKLR